MKRFPGMASMSLSATNRSVGALFWRSVVLAGLVALLLTFPEGPSALAQDGTEPKVDSSETRPVPEGEKDKADEKGNEEEGYQMSKSPTLAMLYAIVPGGGQLYTEQYWKVPLFAIPIGTMIGVSIYNTGQYNEYADQLKNIHPDSAEYSIIRSRRETYRDRRDLSIAVTAGVYLLSLIDAYVGAHLFDFNVDDELSGVYLFPDAERNGLGVGVRW